MNQNEEHKLDNSSMNILDLDKLDSDTDINYEEMIKSEEYLLTEEETETIRPQKGFKDIFLQINWHIVLLVVFIFTVVFIVVKFRNWSNVVDLDQLFTDEELAADPEIETLDNILPNLEAEGSVAATDGVTNIVLFGNGPFAEDYGTSANLGEIIADMADATVYNCSVSGSHLAATNYTFSADEDAMDAFNFYWLTTFAALDNSQPCDAAMTDAPEALPEEADDVYEILSTLDFSKVDVIGIMYDASDYLQGRTLYNVQKETDIQTFYGNLTAGIELLQTTYPHIRIIVMSPTYAYAINSAGEYVDSDIYVYNEHPLSTYAQMLDRSTSIAGVSFVDNFYGTVNVNNASDYLIDNIHLNKDGKQKLAERFVYALQYYD